MKKIVEKLQNISGYECDEDVVVYGLGGIIGTFISIVLLVIVSYFIHGFRELLFFIPIHMVGVRHTGGYHAKTQLRCQALNIISFLMVYGLTRTLHMDWLMICLLAGACSWYICQTSPVLNINKPMTTEEISGNRNKAKIFVAVLDIAIIFSLFIISFQWIAVTLLSNMIEIVIFMFLGRRLYAYEKERDGNVDAENG